MPQYGSPGAFRQALEAADLLGGKRAPRMPTDENDAEGRIATRQWGGQHDGVAVPKRSLVGGDEAGIGRRLLGIGLQ